MTDFDLKNLLQSFGVSSEDADKIDEMIDTTIGLHYGVLEDDLSVYGYARGGKVLSHGRNDILHGEEQ